MHMTFTKQVMMMTTLDAGVSLADRWRYGMDGALLGYWLLFGVRSSRDGSRAERQDVSGGSRPATTVRNAPALLVRTIRKRPRADNPLIYDAVGHAHIAHRLLHTNSFLIGAHMKILWPKTIIGGGDGWKGPVAALRTTHCIARRWAGDVVSEPPSCVVAMVLWQCKFALFANL